MVAPPCFGLFPAKEWSLLPVALKFLKLTSYQAVSHTGFAPPEVKSENRLLEMPSHRTLGMMVKGTTGLLASSSSAVRKHSVAASSLPWACSTSPRLFQTSWAVEFTWTASLRIFSAKLKRPSWWSIRACKKTKGKWLRLASKAFLKLKPGHCSDIRVGSSWAQSVRLCNFYLFFFNLRK